MWLKSSWAQRKEEVNDNGNDDACRINNMQTEFESSNVRWTMYNASNQQPANK